MRGNDRGVRAPRALTIPAELRAEIARTLEAQGLDRRDVRFEAGTEPAQRWTLVNALLARVEEWEGERRMAGFMARHSEVLERIRASREVLAGKARTCFQLLRDMAASTETDRAREAARRYAEDFSEQLEALRHEILDLVSRGVLDCELTDGGRSQRLEKLGFVVPAARTRLTLNQMMALLLMLGGVMLAGFVVAHGGQARGELIVRAVMVATIYTVAVAFAVFPKERWAVAQRTPDGARPYAVYVASAFAAAVASQSISLLVNAALVRDLGSAFHRLACPWGLVTFGATLVSAYLVDDLPPVRWRRAHAVGEGLVASAALTGAAYLTHCWLFQLDLAAPGMYRVPQLPFALVVAGAAGFIIGWRVPTWYREAPRARAVAESGVAASPVAAASACGHAAAPARG